MTFFLLMTTKEIINININTNISYMKRKQTFGSFSFKLINKLKQVNKQDNELK